MKRKTLLFLSLFVILFFAVAFSGLESYADPTCTPVATSTPWPCNGAGYTEGFEGSPPTHDFFKGISILLSPQTSSLMSMPISG